MTLFYCPKHERAAIELSGEAVGSFLNDLLTSEISKLPVGEMQMSCLLSPQGRILHDMLIFRIKADRFWIEVSKNQMLSLKKSFEMYRLRKIVTIKILKKWCSGHLFYKNEKHFTPEKIKEIRLDLNDNEFIFKDPRCVALGLHLIKNDKISKETKRNWKEVELPTWEIIRISNMVPLGNTDLTQNRALALEANLDIFSAVDFNKGCFIGQEVTARTKYRGLVKKRLIPISSKAALKKDMRIFQNEKEIGICHSSIRLENGSYLALATLRLDAIKLNINAKKTLKSNLASVAIEIPSWYELKTVLK